MTKTFKLIAFVFLLAALSFGQLSTTNTTLSAAISANTTNEWCLASATGVVTPSLSSATAGSILFVDREAAQVTASGSISTCFKVKRGQLGTSAAAAHLSGAKVWVGAPSTGSGDTSRPFSGAFVAVAPSGSCTRSAQYTLPVIVTGAPNGGASAGSVYDCVSGVWVTGVTQASTSKPYTFFTTISPPNPISTASVTYVAGTIFSGQIYIPSSTTLTGACVMNGATVGTDKVIYALYDASGALVANTATAGTTTATASKYQCLAFTSTVAVYGPQTYYIAIQGNGTTDNFQSYAANGAPTNYGTNSQTGTFGTLAAITPSATFTASKGPLAMVY